jgi:hypothetical protein
LDPKQVTNIVSAMANIHTFAAEVVGLLKKNSAGKAREVA